ncbi:MAG: hypothetical protein AB1567_12285 [bacterium]
MQDIVGGFRKVIQDLLVPELKAVQVELKHHSEQLEIICNRLENDGVKCKNSSI